MPRDDLPTSPSEQHKDHRVYTRYGGVGMPKVYKRRICDDDRNYTPYQFTMPGPAFSGLKGPQEVMDHDYYVASIKASVGRHDDGTHPDDGTPSGQSIQVNMYRVTKDHSGSAKILNSDGRVEIEIDQHHDSTLDNDENKLVRGDFNILKVFRGESIYPYVVRAGSGRPGTGLVVTAMLIPIP